MVVLITGVTGFLGGVVTKHLIEEEGYKPDELRFLARNNEKAKEFSELGLELFYGDLAKPDTLKGIMKDVTDVYHNAAIVINEAATEEIMYKINHLGTMALVEEFLKSNTAHKFNFASTFGAYGFKFPKHPVSEDFPLQPANFYQKSKVMVEKDLTKKHNEQGLNFTAYRYPLIVGPRDTLTSYRLCKGLLNGKIAYIGHGRNTFSMIDARDGARAMVACSENGNSSGEIYNIKSFDISQNDYFNHYSDALGIARPKKRYPKWFLLSLAWFSEMTTPKDKEVLITRTRVNRYSEVRLTDISKIQKEVNFQPKHTDSKKVITESVNWLLDNKMLN